jgi:hypothetical protein
MEINEALETIRAALAVVQNSSHNSDYATALSDLQRFIHNHEWGIHEESDLQSIYERLNSAKAPNCA